MVHQVEEALHQVAVVPLLDVVVLHPVIQIIEVLLLVIPTIVDHLLTEEEWVDREVLEDHREDHQEDKDVVVRDPQQAIYSEAINEDSS